jgi:hypothetical protein
MVTTNPNERGNYTVIHATGWSKGDSIESKTRLVVIRFSDTKKPMRFAVRWQTGRGDNGPTFGGSAYGSKETAYEAFMNQYMDHNAIYRKGNPSHLPNIVK